MIPASREEVVIVVGWKHVISALAIISLVVVGWSALSVLGRPNLSVSTDKAEYLPGDRVGIEGSVQEPWFPGFRALADEPVAIEVRYKEKVIWVGQVKTDFTGNFAASFTLREDSETGSYRVYASTRAAQKVSTFSVRP